MQTHHRPGVSSGTPASNASAYDGITPTLEEVRGAELLRDVDACRMADAVADGTLHEQPWLLTAYRRSRAEHATLRAAHGAELGVFLASARAAREVGR